MDAVSIGSSMASSLMSTPDPLPTFRSEQQTQSDHARSPHKRKPAQREIPSSVVSADAPSTRGIEDLAERPADAIDVRRHLLGGPAQHLSSDEMDRTTAVRHEVRGVEDAATIELLTGVGPGQCVVGRAGDDGRTNPAG